MLGFEQSRFVVFVAKKSKCLKLLCGKIILRKPFAVCVRHRILPNQLVSHRGDKDFYLLLQYSTFCGSSRCSFPAIVSGAYLDRFISNLIKVLGMATALHTDLKQRNHWIQFFRAIAIIAVVMIHTTPEGWHQLYVQPWTNFAVATFLFLSGYLTNIESKEWSALCSRRIRRVMVPYVVWAVIYSLPYVVKEGVGTLIPGLLKAAWCPPLYYILVYVQLVLLTPLLARLARSKYRHIGWWLAPLALLLFKYDSCWGGNLDVCFNWLWPDLCYFFFAWLTFYYFGLMLGNRVITLPRLSLGTLFVGYLCAVGLQIAEGHCWVNLGWGSAGSQLTLTAMLSSIVFLWFVHEVVQSMQHRSVATVWQSLGNYSFGIYLSHILVMTILKRIPYYESLPFPLNAVVVVLIAWWGCVVGYKWLPHRVNQWLGLK